MLAGDPDASSYLNRAENLEKIAGRVAEEAALAAQGATTILLVGLVLFDRPAPYPGLLRQHAL